MDSRDDCCYNYSPQTLSYDRKFKALVVSEVCHNKNFYEQIGKTVGGDSKKCAGGENVKLVDAWDIFLLPPYSLNNGPRRRAQCVQGFELEIKILSRN
jgi:hypothetical protein